jgi:hypothetical protein
MVWDHTFMKRKTSRRANVHVPSQFTAPKRRMPMSVFAVPVWGFVCMVIPFCTVGGCIRR